MTWRGDEADLYRELAPLLTRRLRAILRTPDDNLIDEACSRAWEIFAQRQAAGRDAERESLLAWLTTVAKHEAFRIIREPAHQELDEAAELANRHDPLAAWLELYDAFDAIQELSPRMREILSDRLTGLTYEEIALARGRTYRNVDRWVNRTNERLAQIRQERATDDRGNPIVNLSARRIDQLERQPPPYLLATLGPAIPGDAQRGGQTARLAWRRGALVIERYREEHGIADHVRPLGAEPTDPLARRLYHATWASIRRAQAVIRGTWDRGPSR
jgi:DNA-directed RNA polymerase specialized sigma24 family protein